MTTLIVREFLAGSCRVNEIERGLPGISRTLLAGRLRLLESAGVLVRQLGDNGRATEYHLTAAGEDLRNVIESFGRWGVRWAFGDPRPEEIDPVLLMWKIHQRINRHLLPPRRVVVEFEFAGQRRRRLWLVLKSDDVSLCLKPPGFDADLLITADLGAFCIWLGRSSFDMAIRASKVRLEGPPALTRAFPR